MSTKTPAESVSELGAEISKGAIRQAVWEYIEKNDLVDFPRPCYRRIPNVKGAATAAEKLITLDEFKKAQTVKINPDKPQENARFLTLEADKTLLVPTPRLRTGLFNKIVPPEGCNKDILRICATTQGVREHSEPIGLDTKVKCDLVVIGSVAVTKTGLRIGKGEGFADMEYAMMRSMGAVDENTIIMTTVHDCQVMDFPESLIEDHDLVVDYVITPTEIIKCNRTRTKPTGIIWSKITPDKLRRVPVLRKLRKIEEAEGKDVTLKDGAAPPDIKTEDEGEESDRQQYRRPPFYRRRRPYNRRPRKDRNSENEEGKGDNRAESEREGKSGDEEHQRPKRPQRRRRFRRRRNTSENKENEEPRSGDEGRNRRSVGESENEGDENKSRRRRRPPPRRRYRGNQNRRNTEGEESEGQQQGQSQRQGYSPRRRRGPPRDPIPTIFVGSVQRSVRVSELKTKIREKNVNPLRVIWNGAKCYALLQFPKLNEMEAAFDTLQDFEMNGKKLKVEISNRVKQFLDEQQGKDGQVAVNGGDQPEN